ncbi:MAG: hypothetical protein KBD47_03110 [Candidatus Pacebacteria bacterium]|nr:hypothetical protein [Candidatus Paceibacterota bacterium]
MKNIIKIVSSALVAILALGTVAFAAPGTQSNGSSAGANSAPTSQSNGNSAGTAGTGPGTQSNGNSAGTAGTGPGTQSNGNSAGTVDSSTGSGNGSTGSSKSSRRSSGGGYRTTIALTNVKVNVVGNKATVTWDTTPAATGMLVYGPLSLATPTNATSFYGYAVGTAVTGATTKHSHTFTMAPNVTYYVRPVAILGSRVVYGSEVKINKTTGTTITKTGAPAVGTIFDAPTKTKIETKIPVDVEVSKDGGKNVANVKDAAPSKIGSFFKKIWNTITSPFCN